jgi:thioredoxin reductase (NADPH)
MLAEIAHLCGQKGLGRNTLRCREIADKCKVFVRQRNYERTHMATIPCCHPAAKIPLTAQVEIGSLSKCSSTELRLPWVGPDTRFSAAMEKVVIIGTGCAGLTASLYTARANLNPLVLTGIMPGGLLTTTSIVENFPGFPEGIDGYELMVRMQKQAERFGARIQFATVESIDASRRPFVLTIDGEKVEAETVIIASGAGHKHLGLESEDKLEKKGVTYCATCDGALPMFRNQPLVVVGGGDSACEEATYLTRFASVVYLIHRRDSLRASKIMAERTLAHAKIKPIWDSAVVEVLDVQQDKVTGVRLKNLKTNAETVLDCAGLFIAIGHMPNTQIFKGLIDMDENGYIIPKHGTATNIEGIFVAGDCSDHVYRQAVTAAGQGCAAAIDAERYLASRNE